MKKTLTKSFAVLAAAFLLQVTTSENANAFFIEPYIGVGFGKADIGTSDSSSHTALGLRAGTEFAGLAFAALDASMMKSKIDTATARKFNRTTIGAVAGVDLPLIRAWFGYNFKDDWSGDDNNTLFDLEGKSTKLGVGLGMLPFIEINLEYIMFSADKFVLSGSSSDSDAEDNTVLLSVSLPLP